MKFELRAGEIEAELDALTGGAFTRLSRRHDDGSCGRTREGTQEAAS